MLPSKYEPKYTVKYGAKMVELWRARVAFLEAAYDSGTVKPEDHLYEYADKGDAIHAAQQFYMMRKMLGKDVETIRRALERDKDKLPPDIYDMEENAFFDLEAEFKSFSHVTFSRDGRKLLVRHKEVDPTPEETNKLEERIAKLPERMMGSDRVYYDIATRRRNEGLPPLPWPHGEREEDGKPPDVS